MKGNDIIMNLQISDLINGDKIKLILKDGSKKYLTIIHAEVSSFWATDKTGDKSCYRIQDITSITSIK